MRVHLIKKQSIEDFVKHNQNSRNAFRFWLSIIQSAEWKKPEDIVSTFNTADILGKGTQRVVFNIGGNHYRMICKYHFGKSMVHLFVKWIGNHAEYTKLCKTNSQYDISDY